MQILTDNSWDALYTKISSFLTNYFEDDNCMFFRGHSDSSWKLLPTLGRIKNPIDSETEESYFFDFQTRAGSLIPSNSTPWDIAMYMQHHGLPTRLLDWTETFSIALYFATRDCEGDCCVWALDPFELNNLSFNEDKIFHYSELNWDYDDLYSENSKSSTPAVVAVSPLRHYGRVFNQKSGLTIHADPISPLEDLFSSCLTKIVIPNSALAGAKTFLSMSGTSEFSVFPDLDGLAREIKREYF